MLRHILAVLLAASWLVACEPVQTPVTKADADTLRMVDSTGRPISSLEAGANLSASARGLTPMATYEFELTLDGKQVSYARLAADRRGTIDPFILLFQSGVVGCALSEEQLKLSQRPLAFRNFDEAAQALTGRRFGVSLREAVPITGKERRGARSAGPALLSGKRIAQIDIPVVAPSAPMVYPSNKDGCLRNSAPASSQDMFVSGRNFAPNQLVDVSVVANQRQWHVGDTVDDITGVAAAAATERVRADAQGRFTVAVWPRGLQRRGTYDIVGHPVSGIGGGGHFNMTANDTVSYASDTGYILFLYYPPGGTQMDIAGRPLPHWPYYEFSDAFSKTEDVWGAVDPTYVPSSVASGTYAAYYTVAHKSTAGWAGDTSLIDISGGIEIMPVKAGCINMTDTVIWYAPLVKGDYDVVVNFGSTPASSTVPFVDDFTYDNAQDFLDGGVQIGFRVAEDPYDLNPAVAIGSATYSFDDLLFLSNSVSTFEGAAPGTPNVDLRAIVRYPATATGTNTPVAPGPHPIFIIEHGNHDICDDPQIIDHLVCPVAQRKLNHEGYTHLLEALASHGIIAVSIDAFDLTGWVPQWPQERGDLILKHLEFWSHLNDPSTYAGSGYSDPFGGLFLNHVDLSKISVSGHSRGGEASVSAYVRNFLRPVAQQFAIGSVSSIAPVDFPDDSSNYYNLGDVPYFVILPAGDCDVSDLAGQRLYDRAGGAGDVTVKSGIHVYGANHNFFNTVWAADGDDCGGSGRPDYIPAADQQKIGEAYLAAFVRSQLLGEDVYEDLLRGRMSFPSFAGRKIYNIRHDKNHLTLDDGTAAGTVMAGAMESVIANPPPHQTNAVVLTWTGNGQSYTYAIPPTDVSGFEVLSFRVAQTASSVNPATGQDFYVQVTQGSHVSSAGAAQFYPIPPPYPGTGHTVMTTVRIPLHSFIINNSQVDLTQIDAVKFIFNNTSQGEVYVDDVEFSR